MKKLVIDLGHGGSDPGAIGQNGTREANVVKSTVKKGISFGSCLAIVISYTAWKSIP